MEDVRKSMGNLILFHGSPNREVLPIFGKGEDKHDYGRGFYLTENIDLVKEWRYAILMEPMVLFININWI